MVMAWSELEGQTLRSSIFLLRFCFSWSLGPASDSLGFRLATPVIVFLMA